jgi:integrase
MDFDNLLMTVRGKGDKRIVPFSIELRRVLFKFLCRHNFELVFPTRDGGKMLYDNSGVITCGYFQSLESRNATSRSTPCGGDLRKTTFDVVGTRSTSNGQWAIQIFELHESMWRLRLELSGKRTCEHHS